jgi:hypothetical protein
MPAYLLQNIPQRITDSSGTIVVSPKVYFYTTGTTTPKNAYSDAAGSTPLSNPLTGNADGTLPQIFLAGDSAYRVKITSNDGLTTYSTWDDVTGIAGVVDLLNPTDPTQGAALIGFTLNAIGATARNLYARGNDVVYLSDFSGVDNTGATECSAALQAALTATRSNGAPTNQGKVLYWGRGTYKCGSGLTLGSNQTIVFDSGVTINFTGDVNTSLFTSANQSGNYLYGNGAVLNGNRAGVTLSNSGNQNAIYLYGSDNVLIQDFNIVGFAMDGITITGDNAASGPSTNVRIVGVDSYNNGRNGMSIIHAIGVLVDGGRYWGSNGTPSGPWAGIDIEPNANEVAQGIVIRGVRTQQNAGAGLQFTPGAMSSSAGLTFDVTVVGGRSTTDSTATAAGSIGKAAILFANGSTLANEVLGQVVVRDFVIDSPACMGVNFQNWDASNAPRVILDNVSVINPNGASGSTGNQNQSGFTIYCDSTQAVSALGKITLRNCKAQDTRGSPKMVWGGLVSADTGKTVQDVIIQDFTAVNYTSSSKYPVKTDVANSGTLVDVVVSYTSPKPVSSAASITDPGWGGQRVNLTTGGSSFTLPLAAKCKGMYYEVQADQAAASNCSVVRTSTDVVKANGVASATSYVLQPGDIARFRSEGGTYWSVAGVN